MGSNLKGRLAGVDQIRCPPVQINIFRINSNRQRHSSPYRWMTQGDPSSVYLGVFPRPNLPISVDSLALFLSATVVCPPARPRETSRDNRSGVPNPVQNKDSRTKVSAPRPRRPTTRPSTAPLVTSTGSTRHMDSTTSTRGPKTLSLCLFW